jgi:hypothetical protein
VTVPSGYEGNISRSLRALKEWASMAVVFKPSVSGSEFFSMPSTMKSQPSDSIADNAAYV